MRYVGYALGVLVMCAIGHAMGWLIGLSHDACVAIGVSVGYASGLDYLSHKDPKASNA